MPGKKQLYVDKNLITITPLFNTLIIALVVPDQMFFLSSSLAHLLRVWKITLRLPKTFSPGILMRSTCGNSFAFAARVPFHLGCCLLLPFEVRFETKGKWLLFCCFTQNYTARERVSTPRSPFRLLDFTSNFHLSPVRDTCTLQTNKDWLTA